MTIEKAFIQEKGNGKLRHEEELVISGLNKRNIPYSLYTEKRIRRRQLPLDSSSLVVGDMLCIYGALKQLKIPIPEAISYPPSLHNFLHRKTWETTLRGLEEKLWNEEQKPIFAKPSSQQKRFTGRIFSSASDLYYVSHVSRNEILTCSEIVKWISEYRVYVVNSEIRAIDNYDGDPDIMVSRDTIENAIETLGQNNESYAGYAIDFGVLDTGETALIEMNDGFAVGAYSIDSENYTDMVLARWDELLKEIEE